jgi:hypothetical protein
VDGEERLYRHKEGSELEIALSDAAPEPKRMSREGLQSELDYWRAQQILTAMLHHRLISREEFREITLLNRQSFIPVLSQIMPEIR